ncbi:MAG: XRE family transcriptional regulator [Muribaculaceae bacterium]|nr:XRE family transcriptional regulator [Muribaculaceae bacterium]
MKKTVLEPLEREPIFIGKIIEEELRRQERTVTWLSRKIHCDRSNVYDIFSRSSIDTDLLYKISVALNKDFFTFYSTNFQSFINQQIIPTRNLTTIFGANGPNDPNFQ